MATLRTPNNANPKAFGGGGGFHQGGGHHRPAEDLYAEGGPVENLRTEDFAQVNRDSDYLWVLEFYAPNCGHCRQLKPNFEKAAQSLKGVVRFAAVNCDHHRQLCADNDVRGYPTIVAVVPGEDERPEYEGDRSARSLKVSLEGGRLRGTGGGLSYVPGSWLSSLSINDSRYIHDNSIVRRPV